MNHVRGGGGGGGEWWCHKFCPGDEEGGGGGSYHSYLGGVVLFPSLILSIFSPSYTLTDDIGLVLYMCVPIM